MERSRTKRLLDHFARGEEQKIKERKEREKRKEGKKENHKEKKIGRGREPDQRRAVVGPGQAQNETELQDVGVFLPRFYSTPRGRLMAYGFRQVSGRICMVCSLFVIMGWSWTEYMSSRDHRGRAQHPETDQIWVEWETGLCQNFHTTLVNQHHQLRMTITFPSELQFACSWTLRKACEVYNLIR